MILAIDSNKTTGWGICGSYLRQELHSSKLPKLPDDIVIHPISGHTFLPLKPELAGRVNIGICFFENQWEAKRNVANATFFDHIFFGSDWNTSLAKEWGIENCSTMHQGVDFDLFWPRKRKPDGRFVVGSFGKAEIRKGQDIVIAAMREFMAEHADVYLSASWYNPWPHSLATLKESRYIRWVDAGGCLDSLAATCEANGLPMDRVELHPPLEHRFMGDLYRECDVAVFPNRAEGGTNLPLMETIACEVPVIATSETGQRDVMLGYGFSAADQQNWPMSMGRREPDATWPEPCINKVLSRLLSAYKHRDVPPESVSVLKEHVKRFTWENAAKAVWEVAKNHEV